MNANVLKKIDEGKPTSRQVIGCAFEVSNVLGSGFLESVYENALCIELAEQRISFEWQKELVVRYKDRIVGTLVVGESCVMFNVFSHTKPQRHEEFFPAVADHPRDFHCQVPDDYEGLF